MPEGISRPESMVESQNLIHDAGVEIEPDIPQVDPIDHIITGVVADELDEKNLNALIDCHPDVQTITARLENLRNGQTKAPNQERELVDAIRAKRGEIGRQIKERLGVIEESPEDKERRLEIERLRRLGTILTTLKHKEPDDELLAKFGLIDNNGNMTEGSMDSPLFRSDTRRAFNQYLDYAREYDRLERAEKEAGLRLINTVEAEVLRFDAHNAVARLVARDFGLPYDSARRFVAKAREAVTPGLHEKTDYATLLRGQSLADKFGRDALALTKESLKSFIDSPMDHERSQSSDSLIG
jgi:hypothetical protein